MLLALQPWPSVDEGALDDGLEASFSELIAAIRVVRNLRAVAGLKPSQSVPVPFRILISCKEPLWTLRFWS